LRWYAIRSADRYTNIPAGTGLTLLVAGCSFAEGGGVAWVILTERSRPWFAAVAAPPG
jgi:hypothetical protein